MIQFFHIATLESLLDQHLEIISGIQDFLFLTWFSSSPESLESEAQELDRSYFISFLEENFLIEQMAKVYDLASYCDEMVPKAQEFVGNSSDQALLALEMVLENVALIVYLTELVP